MNYLNYQYCATKFVVTDEYKIDFFTKDSEPGEPEYFFFQTLKEDINRADLQTQLGQIKKIYVPEEGIYKYLNKEKEFYSYDPLGDTPEMYLEMNKIVIFDKKSIMKFIKNYGLPFNEIKPKYESVHFDSTLFPDLEHEKFILGMDALLFYEKLSHFQNVLKMWNIILGGTTQELTTIKNEFQFYAEFYKECKPPSDETSSLRDFAKLMYKTLELGYKGAEIEDLLKRFNTSPEKLLKLNERVSELNYSWNKVKKDPNLVTIAYTYLNIKLKELDCGETTSSCIDGKIVPAMKFNNLLEVAGYQLKQAIFKNQKLMECENCGALFEPRHASQRFCSPLPRRKRSTCENTYNQRLKRLRKKTQNH